MICDQGNVQPHLPARLSFAPNRHACCMFVSMSRAAQLGCAWPLHLMQTNETLWNELILRMINTSNAKSSPNSVALIAKAPSQLGCS